VRAELALVVPQRLQRYPVTLTAPSSRHSHTRSS